MKRIIEVSVTVALLAGVITLIFAFYNSGKKSASAAMDTVNEKLNKYSDKYAAYENTSISGEELIELVKSTEVDDISIIVKTGMDTSGTTYTDGKDSDNKAEYSKTSSTKYINPYKTFRCTEVTVNNNGVITKLTFEQK